MGTLVKIGKTVETAKRNKIVWREVDPADEPELCGSWYPSRLGSYGPYKFNKVVRAQKKVIEGTKGKRIRIVDISYLSLLPADPGYEVCEGFHSWTRKPGFIFADSKLCWAIIPKGSQYVLGEFSEIVSLDIIVFFSFWKFIKYLICTRQKN